MIAARLTFFGACSEAADFYCKVFGGEIVEKIYFGEQTDQFPIDLSQETCRYIYSISLRVVDESGKSYINMGDSPVLAFAESQGNQGCRDNIVFDMSLGSVEEVDRIYNTFIQDGAKCNIALCEKDGYGRYASFIDRFGVCWNIFSKTP